MMMKAMMDATAWVAITAAWAGSQANAPSITWASAGSPIQPSPREASVIPSCVAEM